MIGTLGREDFNDSHIYLIVSLSQYTPQYYRYFLIMGIYNYCSIITRAGAEKATPMPHTPKHFYLCSVPRVVISGGCSYRHVHYVARVLIRESMMHNQMFLEDEPFQALVLRQTCTFRRRLRHRIGMWSRNFDLEQSCSLLGWKKSNVITRHAHR